MRWLLLCTGRRRFGATRIVQCMTSLNQSSFPMRDKPEPKLDSNAEANPLAGFARQDGGENRSSVAAHSVAAPARIVYVQSSTS